MKRHRHIPLSGLTAVLTALALLMGCSLPQGGTVSGTGGTDPLLSSPEDRELQVPEAGAPVQRIQGAWYSSATGGEIREEIAFCDDWFSADPAVANPELALCSMQIEAACGSTSGGASLLTELGFARVNALHYTEGSFDRCAYTAGEKDITVGGSPCTLRAVFVQGTRYDETGWEQNVLTNGDITAPSHWGYTRAVEQLLEEQASEDSGPVIWWIVGYSRGAGIANLFAARLAEQGQTVFGYTFAAPAVTDGDPAAGGPLYAGIHNYLCDDDPVPMVPLWGMVRYGQDHSLSILSPEEVAQALAEQNPAAYDAVGQHYDGMWTVTYGSDGTVTGGELLGDFLRRKLTALEAAVPTRESYSALRRDVYTLEDGDGEILWSPQDAMVCLVRMVYFSAPLPFDSTQAAAPLLRELICGELEAALAAETGDEALAAAAAGRRWQLAKSLQAELGGQGVTPEGIYGLIVLLSPLLIRSEDVLSVGALPELDDMTPAELLIRYAPEALNFLSSGDELVFSHHTDTLILRLHLLCRD